MRLLSTSSRLSEEQDSRKHDYGCEGREKTLGEESDDKIKFIEPRVFVKSDYKHKPSLTFTENDLLQTRLDKKKFMVTNRKDYSMNVTIGIFLEI